MSLIRSIIEEMDLTDGEVGRILERESDLRAALPKVLRVNTRKRGAYKERTITVLDHQPRFNVLPLKDQAKILKGYFPEIEIDYGLLAKWQERKLAKYADGWFVAPRPELVGGTPQEALGQMFRALGDACGGLMIWGQYFKKGIHPTSESERLMKILFEQDGDLVVFQAQLGMARSGWSADYFERARVDDEISLPTYLTAASLATNPHRLLNGSDLGIICSSDRVGMTRKGMAETIAPVFFKLRNQTKTGKVMLGTLTTKGASMQMGVASILGVDMFS